MYLPETEDWGPMTDEAYLQFLSERAFEAEKHAYLVMQDLQDIDIPCFESEVMAMLPENDPTQSNPSHEPFSCPGILLKYIHGFELTDLTEKLPSEHWQKVFDDALRILYEAGERGICNPDVDLRSFIVRYDPIYYPNPKAFMLDFGECGFRDRMLHEKQFRSYQAHMDEEGRLAHMKFMLKKQHGFDLHYTQSERSRGLQRDFRRAEHKHFAYLVTKDL